MPRISARGRLVDGLWVACAFTGFVTATLNLRASYLEPTAWMGGVIVALLVALLARSSLWVAARQ